MPGNFAQNSLAAHGEKPTPKPRVQRTFFKTRPARLDMWCISPVVRTQPENKHLPILCDHLSPRTRFRMKFSSKNSSSSTGKNFTNFPCLQTHCGAARVIKTGKMGLRIEGQGKKGKMEENWGKFGKLGKTEENCGKLGETGGKPGKNRGKAGEKPGKRRARNAGQVPGKRKMSRKTGEKPGKRRDKGQKWEISRKKKRNPGNSKAKTKTTTENRE